MQFEPFSTIEEWLFAIRTNDARSDFKNTGIESILRD